MIGMAEHPRIIGTTVFNRELIEVVDRAEEPDTLWLRRIYPRPRYEYGVVRFPLTDAMYGPSMWTLSWSPSQRRVVCELVAALYRHWTDHGSPPLSTLAHATTLRLRRLLEASTGIDPSLDLDAAPPGSRAPHRLPPWTAARMRHGLAEPS